MRKLGFAELKEMGEQIEREVSGGKAYDFSELLSKSRVYGKLHRILTRVEASFFWRKVNIWSSKCAQFEQSESIIKTPPFQATERKPIDGPKTPYCF